MTTRIHTHGCIRPLALAMAGLLFTVAAEARPVTVRVYTGPRWVEGDRDTSRSFAAKTVSASEDLKKLSNTNPYQTNIAGTIKDEEEVQRYPRSDLVPGHMTGLEKQLNNINRPTEICFCTGHALLMGKRFGLKGVVSPIPAGGHELFDIARDWAGDMPPDKKPGDLVFFMSGFMKRVSSTFMPQRNLQGTTMTQLPSSGCLGPI